MPRWRESITSTVWCSREISIPLFTPWSHPLIFFLSSSFKCGPWCYFWRCPLMVSLMFFVVVSYAVHWCCPLIMSLDLSLWRYPFCTFPPFLVLWCFQYLLIFSQLASYASLDLFSAPLDSPFPWFSIPLIFLVLSFDVVHWYFIGVVHEYYPWFFQFLIFFLSFFWPFTISLQGQRERMICAHRRGRMKLFTTCGRAISILCILWAPGGYTSSCPLLVGYTTGELLNLAPRPCLALSFDPRLLDQLSSYFPLFLLFPRTIPFHPLLLLFFISLVSSLRYILSTLCFLIFLSYTMIILLLLGLLAVVSSVYAEGKILRLVSFTPLSWSLYFAVVIVVVVVMMMVVVSSTISIPMSLVSSTSSPLLFAHKDILPHLCTSSSHQINSYQLHTYPLSPGHPWIRVKNRYAWMSYSQTICFFM